MYYVYCIKHRHIIYIDIFYCALSMKALEKLLASRSPDSQCCLGLRAPLAGDGVAGQHPPAALRPRGQRDFL